MLTSLFLPLFLASSTAGASAARPEAPLRALQEPATTGRLEWIGPKVHKAGTVVEGQLVTHTLRFMNGDDSGLVVDNIQPTCKCMTIAAVRDRGLLGQEPFEPGTVLEPGEVMELALTIDTSGKSGTFHARVEIEHSGSPRPDYARVIMDLVPPFSFEPAAFAIGTLKPNDVRTGTIELRNAFGQPFVPELRANRFEEHIDVDLRPIEPNAEGLAARWAVDCTVRGGLPYRKNHLYPLTFGARLTGRDGFGATSSDGSAAFVFKTFVQAEAVDWIVAEPQALSFGRLWADREYEQTCVVRNHDDGFQLTIGNADVVIEGPGEGDFHWRDNVQLTVTPTPEDRAVHVKMTVSGLPKVMNRPFRGHLVVATGHPKIGDLRIPFRGRHR